MIFFISATDTGVGKTYFSYLLAKKFLSEGKKTKYIKLVQTGYPEDDDSAFVSKSKAEAKTLYFGKEPLAPYFIFKNFPVDEAISRLKSEEVDYTIVEGSGGLLVPLDKNNFIVDIPKRMNLRTIVVVPNKLGCINQTLLNLYYCEKEGINLYGFALNDFFMTTFDNFDVLEKLTRKIKYRFKDDIITI
ncbi:dethiobiotin synthase [Thermodesulfobium narugense DSM 14796]|uniref:ATP-dependent dethiobiotin synthetase BioD n=1 Tax=Thermodesulfobium narugense DSM 14796 TaxID=747365 RepID=M1E653_9BACT|nr:dethiobiotin synthase [Thermodesulfobium narugense]AEE15432.1 dethiobiotin synthase [Thermodesulfobium narugense DSM 14796]